jgi:hypothetical protein
MTGRWRLIGVVLAFVAGVFVGSVVVPTLQRLKDMPDLQTVNLGSAVTLNAIRRVMPARTVASWTSLCVPPEGCRWHYLVS